MNFILFFIFININKYESWCQIFIAISLHHFSGKLNFSGEEEEKGFDLKSWKKVFFFLSSLKNYIRRKIWKVFEEEKKLFWLKKILKSKATRDRTRNSPWLEVKCSDVVPKVLDKSKLLSPRTVSTTTTAAATTATATPVPFFFVNRSTVNYYCKLLL